MRVSVRNAGSTADFEDQATVNMTITSGSGELSAPGTTERFAARFASWRSRRFDDGPHMSLVASMPRLATNTAAGDPKKYSFYTPQLNLLSETDYTAAATPAIANDYIWFNGQPVAQVEVATSTPHWTFTDHLGTPLIQTDAAGAIDWRAEQEPYGTVYALRVGTARHQPLRFPGQEYDELTSDREYNIFRWYREGWGRYTQADPMGLASGSNLFDYSDDDPTLLVDPLGLVPNKRRVGGPTAAPDCSVICGMAYADPALNKGGGGVVCLNGKKCPCAFNTQFSVLGDCPELDAVIVKHEERHVAESTCPSKKLCRAGAQAPRNLTTDECTHRRESVRELRQAIVGGYSTPTCKNKMLQISGLETAWITANCH